MNDRSLHPDRAPHSTSSTTTLNNGFYMPILGLGTWKSKPGEVSQAVEDALEMGYKHIDAAMVYDNEVEVGAGMASAFKAGYAKREEIFVTSKLWNTFHMTKSVVPTLKKTLKDLQLNYLDMYLIHWPMAYKEGDGLFPKAEEGSDRIAYTDTDIMDTWRGMEEAVRLGLTRSIGVSNFNKDQIERIRKEGSILPANIQIEIHPYLPNTEMIKYCQSHGMVVTAYSPLGSPDRPWAKPEDPVLFENKTLVAMAARHHKTPAQICIAFALARGLVVIPKSVTKSRIAANMEVFDIALSMKEIADLVALGCNNRICGLEWINDHKDWPFHTPY